MDCLFQHETITDCRPLWAVVPEAVEWLSPALAPLAMALLLVIATLLLLPGDRT